MSLVFSEEIFFGKFDSKGSLTDLFGNSYVILDSNILAKEADGFTKLFPSFLSALTIILCMYCLSQVMKTISAGYTYATFAGLCIIATIIVGIVKFNQMPDMFTIIGMILIKKLIALYKQKEK